MSKNRCFKMLAWLLSVIMILNMMPIGALADNPLDTNTSPPKEESVTTDDIKYPTPVTSSDDSSDDESGDSLNRSSDGSKSSKSLQYTCEGQSVSMK